MPCQELSFAVRYAVQTPTGQMPRDRDAAFRWFSDEAAKSIQNAALKTITSDNPVRVRAATKRQAIDLAFDHVWSS